MSDTEQEQGGTQTGGTDGGDQADTAASPGDTETGDSGAAADDDTRGE